MKRAEQIIQLSRDHHFGLLFCWKIKQGLCLKVAAARIQAYIRYYWQEQLQQHFHEEETLLFGNREDLLCRQAMKEHREIEQLIQQIAGGNPDVAQFQSLADLLHRHIRYEERTVFPHLEKTLTDEQLNNVGKALQQLHTAPPADNFPDPFWASPQS
ncbi:hypothetical protein A8C56_14490 [Niabella ginsenosidivorans]|uniref:Hemerythrin-like domain-containing protein n=1 Tax=Niabella ginsenosidivorans TaxID=1176587 RepID=A0A1A9I2X2_9BACT|nr:hemerythrin domain-containing protein [Niabella ginsenosidivorans]ANH82018.1 hypothetical protein A8C56_14490 [Niabella ginsenosidivorans]